MIADSQAHACAAQLSPFNAIPNPLMHMGSRLQLDLRGNNIGPAGAAALALGLAANSSLTEVRSLSCLHN